MTSLLNLSFSSIGSTWKEMDRLDKGFSLVNNGLNTAFLPLSENFLDADCRLEESAACFGYADEASSSGDKKDSSFVRLSALLGVTIDFVESATVNDEVDHFVLLAGLTTVPLLIPLFPTDGFFSTSKESKVRVALLHPDRLRNDSGESRLLAVRKSSEMNS